MDVEGTRLQALEDECGRLRKQLVKHGDLQREVELLKSELEKSLETHTKLQALALAFEEENRLMHEKYSAQLIDQAKLDSLTFDLQHEIDTKAQSYVYLEKRFNKMKEKVDDFEALEEKAYNLEKENKKISEQNEKIKDDLETLKKSTENSAKKSEEIIKKLKKENIELTLKLETYIEEMEELDAKVNILEKGNKELKRYSNLATKVDLHSSCVEQLTELENTKLELTKKLNKEIQSRENVENELFKVEEEYETYKKNAENNEVEYKRKIQTLISEQKFFVENDEGNHAMAALHSKQLLIEMLEDEKVKLISKLKTMEEEHEILLEENSSLAHENAKLEEKLELSEKKLLNLKLDYDKLIMITEQLADGGNVDASNNEKSLQDSLMEEIRKCKEELEISQKYLESANNKYLQLQYEAEQKQLQHDKTVVMLQKRSEEQELSIIKLKELNNSYEKQMLKLKGLNDETVKRLSLDINELGETNVLVTRMMDNFETEREEYESRLFELNSKIYGLEQRKLLVTSIENRSVNSNPTSSPETTPPVAIKNGELHDSMENVEKKQKMKKSNSVDTQDSISDRELRRISYKVADGNWSRLPFDLNPGSLEVAQIMNAQIHDKEKVYNLLVVWRNQTHGDRNQQLEQLAELFDSIKRKDVIKFLKEVGGTSKEESGFKNTIKRIKKTVRR